MNSRIWGKECRRITKCLLKVQCKTMDSKETGLETYITWVDFSSPIGCFVLQDGVLCFHQSGNLWREDGEYVAQDSQNLWFAVLHFFSFSPVLVAVQVLTYTFSFCLLFHGDDDRAKPGFDKTLTPLLTPLLTPCKISGKMKIKKAQNYHCDPIQVHQ